MHKRLFHTILVLILFSAAHTVLSQDPGGPTKLRLAQSFEENNDWERAIPLYEELFKADPASFVIADALKRGYVQLKQYDKAIVVTQQQLRLRPNDPALRAAWGGLAYDAGREEQADSLWTAVSLKSNPGTYRMVASQMMERRLYDRTIRLYLRARAETGNEIMFADELGLLYSYMQEYDAATREFIRSLLPAPEQIGYVQTRISSFTMRAAGLKAAIDVTSAEVQRLPGNVSLHLLLGWLAMESKDFDKALVEYRIIEQLKHANGAELFAFAERAQSEGAHAVAARAFREVSTGFSNPAILPRARYGYALAVEHLVSGADSVPSISPGQDIVVSETRPSLAGTLALYQQILVDFPGTFIAAAAWYRLGVIQDDRMSDLDRALDAFSHARSTARGSDLAFQATFRIAELYLAKNDLAGARQELAIIAGGPNPMYRDQAMLRLGELDYFDQQFDSALVRLNYVAKNLNTDLANDALQLIYFINENKLAAPAALSEFARADLLSRQRKYAESLTAFRRVIATYPGTFLIDDALMKAGELQVQLRLFRDALATFSTLADSLPTSILRDKAQFRAAELLERSVKDAGRAIDAYQTLLTKFPNSLYAEEARKRIRHLRGDPL